MSGWNTLFDVANLALNVSQSAQLAVQRSQMEGLVQQSAIEALHRQLVELARNEVFSGTKQLRVLSAYKEEAPAAVLVATSAIQWKLEMTGITPEFFPEFHDKDYVESFLRRLDDVVRDARSRLSEAEALLADQAVQATVQMPLLNEAIKCQESKEAWNANEPIWELLEPKRKKRNLLGWTIAGGTLPLSGALCVISTVAASLVENPSAGMNTVALGWTTMLVLLSVAGVVGGLVISSQGQAKEWRECRDRRKELMAQAPSVAKFQEIYQTFGERTSHEYREMRAAREALINSVLAGAKGYSLPAELLDLEA